jgi:methionyl-tRNA formyltransferase
MPDPVARSTQPGTAPGTVLAATHAGIDVACGRGILRIVRLQLAGRKPLCAGEFIKGRRLDGARLASV